MALLVRQVGARVMPVSRTSSVIMESASDCVSLCPEATLMIYCMKHRYVPPQLPRRV